MELFNEVLPKVGSLAEKLIRLDCFLTGAQLHTAIRTNRHQPKIPAHGGIYYLSDGGYSRIVFHDTGSVFLTSNSTEQVKAKWPLATALINSALEARTLEEER